ncbi:right-handed parallel beta-helix repeat-containing protein [Agrobacterium tumefaciens]|jgi:parallel beta-helix repeat protein|uniref:right-handed parallel beta-helix repeat-containing protein n=1 Tax=Agrobacterium tumefaciens TaxID=358 RepID=UPI001574B1DD|nr:hypothetical protein [Agrobacterium tumefaciens]
MNCFVPTFLIYTVLAGTCNAQTDINGALESVDRAVDGSALLRGWACQSGSSKPAYVRVTFGKPAPTGVALFSVPADREGSAATAGKCGDSGGGHTFQITLSARDTVRFSGMRIFVYAAAGEDNAEGKELANSGTFSLAPTSAPERVDCKSWNGVVDRNIQLQPANCLITKQVVIAKPDLSLDCNGATIDGSNVKILPGSRGQGVGVASEKVTCEHSDASGAESLFIDADGSGSLIKNCKIQNFAFGIYLNRRAWSKPRPNAECIAYPEFSDDNAKIARTPSLNGMLGGRDKRYGYSAADVTVRNVEISKVKDSGIFVNEYAQNWLIEDAGIRANSVGIYLERESRQNRIITSTIASNGNVGIAIDASANNLIEDNVIENNGGIGVALYKNCGESRGVTRYQHTNGNILRHNIIRGQGGMRFGDMTLTMSYLLSLPGVETLSKPGVGVWIASRQGLSRTWMERVTRNQNSACSDTGYSLRGQTFYEDHAKYNQLIENTIYNNGLADVIVEDDNNKLIGNNFSADGNRIPLTSIIIGSIFREQDALLGPVRNISLSDNFLPKKTISGPVMYIGGSKADN